MGGPKSSCLKRTLQLSLFALTRCSLPCKDLGFDSLMTITYQHYQYLVKLLKKPWKPETTHKEEKNFKGHHVTKEPGNRQLQEGFPQWHHETSQSAAGISSESIWRKHAETPAVQLNSKQVIKQFSITLLNWLIDLYAVKIAKTLLVIFLKLKLRDSTSASFKLPSNVNHKTLNVCVYFYVLFMCFIKFSPCIVE